jgi:uncharacterized membrane protein (DUF2068 family)
MVCQACGAPVAAEVRFCPKCGAPVPGPQQTTPGYAPPVYPLPPIFVPRVQRNLQALGILWCVFGVYRVLGGLVGMFFLQLVSLRRFGDYGWSYGTHLSHGPAWITALIPFVVVYTTVVAALALLVGYGLLTRKPWGRTFAIVAAILALFRPLLGTGLGIYTLWVLAPAQSGLEFDAIADRT